MILTQYYLQCLSQGSYLIGDEASGEAIVVDPRRDIAEYLDDAKSQGLRIVGVINTHFHADFVAGHLELAEATGAWIGYGQRAEADYPIRHLAHGDHITLGQVDIEVLETPGHTWESISLLVREHGPDVPPNAVLTGDALFIGDVGRPDLAVSVGASADELGRALYHSVHQILMKLPDDTRLLPAHGAGSACGKNLSDELESTIGAQRTMNLSVQPMSEDEFVDRITTGQPAAPAYFAADAVLNRRRHQTYDRSHEIPAIEPDRLRQLIDDGAQVVDVRSPQDFAVGHLAGSVNVGLDGRFAETAGMVFAPEDHLIVVADPGREQEAAMRLARIGFDNVDGYLHDPVASLAELADLARTSKRLSLPDLEQARHDHHTTVVDVRNPGEREDGHIPGSVHIPLAQLVQRHQELGADRRIVAHCASGWRSSVAASTLRALGHNDVDDVDGGYHDWSQLYVNRQLT